MKSDFHMHSTASDGSMAPDELMRAVRAHGIDAAALTDHDSVEGVVLAARTASSLGISLIPGIEFNTILGEEDVHILAYWVDPTSPRLSRFLEERRIERVRRIERILVLLANRYDIVLEHDEVFAGTDDKALTRLHVARLLVDKGYGESSDEVFSRYMAKGKGAYVRQESMSPADAVALAREIGGLSVLAHPGDLDDPLPLISTLIGAGLGGLEAYYPDHSPSFRDSLIEIARKHDLLVTGGSDFHGSGSRHTCELGGVAVPEKAALQLLEWGQSNK